MLIIHLTCVSNFLYSTGGAPKRRGAWGNIPPTLPLDGAGCVNFNALINVLKKLTQCINAFRKQEI